MNERPILFSGPMVRAILAGAKSQTRRVVKPQPWVGETCTYDGVNTYGQHIFYPDKDSGVAEDDGLRRCPYGVPGDRLWVREPFGCQCHNSAPPLEGCELQYRADGEDQEYPLSGWRPSIHMPRWASRITLEVVGVRVERVQDIIPRDAQAEGAPELSGMPVFYDRGVQCYVDWFRDLWDSINGKRYPWASSPWVWVVEFKVAPTEDTVRPLPLANARASEGAGRD